MGEFQHPSDSFLQKTRIGTDAKTGERTLLTSWKSPADPSIGTFSIGVQPLNIPQLFVWNGSHPYWRSGPWNGQIFIGVRNMFSSYLIGFTLVDDKEGTVSLSYTYPADPSYLVYMLLDSEADLQQKNWLFGGKEDWEVVMSTIEHECDVYGKCGPFESYNSLESPICTCLRGFEPKHMDEWSRGNLSSGCIRKTLLQCEQNNTVNETDKEDGFLKLQAVKVPDFAELSSAIIEDNCGSLCLNNCSCIAYSYYTGIGCMQWSGTLLDILKLSSSGVDLYIEVAYSELDEGKTSK